MVSVKICGVREPAAAEAVAASGADFAGLNFVSWSRRVIEPDAAKKLLPHLGTVVPVGVFADETADDVRFVAKSVGLEWVQLHGMETPESCAELSRNFRIIKGVTIDEHFSPDALDAYAPWVDLFLFDAPRPGGGRRFDWSRIPSSPRPFLLAGGLESKNVARAIEEVRPFGVDTASGVEVRGAQDPARIAEFVETVRKVVTSDVMI